VESAALTSVSPVARIARGDAWALAAWAALISACWAVGTALNDAGSRMLLHAPPLFGGWDLQPGLDLLAPVGVGAAIVIAGPLVAASMPWRLLLGASALAFCAWTLALALTNGAGGITDPLETRPEYLSVIGDLSSPGEFLTTFFDRLEGYPTHVRGHPPGMVLILLGLERAGLGGSVAAAILILSVAATTPAAALVATRAVAGEAAARRAAPYLVLLPAAVYVAISADALYMGVAAWAVAALVVAITSEGPFADAAALAGGVAFGCVAFLSYGLVLLCAVPLAVAAAARTVRPLVLAAIGVGTIVLAFLAAGFWWLDGLVEVREQYAGSIAGSRPYEFFVFNNLAAFALVCGPAVAIALARLRDRRVWLLVGGGLGAVLLADLSGMSKAEVERIWLAFVPWVAVATIALPVRPPATWALLGAQAAVAIAIEAGVSTLW
jgi:hypothetical protein